MKSNSSLLAFATMILTLPLYGVAQSSSVAAPDPAAANAATQLVSADASLLNNLDADKAHTGAEVRARLAGTVHLTDGTKLPSGSILVGHIVADNMQQGDSHLSFNFDQAQLKDGKTVPIKATIVGIVNGTPDAVAHLVEPGHAWTNGPLQIDQDEVTPGIDLHSTIAGANSGTLVSNTKSDVKIRQGTDIQFAIGSASNRASL